MTPEEVARLWELAEQDAFFEGSEQAEFVTSARTALPALLDALEASEAALHNFVEAVWKVLPPADAIAGGRATPEEAAYLSGQRHVWRLIADAIRLRAPRSRPLESRSASGDAPRTTESTE